MPRKRAGERSLRAACGFHDYACLLRESQSRNHRLARRNREPAASRRAAIRTIALISDELIITRLPRDARAGRADFGEVYNNWCPKSVVNSAKSYRFRSPADVRPGIPRGPDLSHTGLVAENAFLDRLARKLEVEIGELAAHRPTLITCLRTRVELNTSNRAIAFRHP